jgi:hypothetical protein
MDLLVGALIRGTSMIDISHRCFRETVLWIVNILMLKHVPSFPHIGTLLSKRHSRGSLWITVIALYSHWCNSSIWNHRILPWYLSPYSLTLIHNLPQTFSAHDGRIVKLLMLNNIIEFHIIHWLSMNKASFLLISWFDLWVIRAFLFSFEKFIDIFRLNLDWRLVMKNASTCWFDHILCCLTPWIIVLCQYSWFI